MNTAIVGYGVVGRATHLSLYNNDISVTAVDVDGIVDFRPGDFDLIYICIPTNNHDDLQTLAAMVRRFYHESQATICVRSSVPVGFISRDMADLRDRIIYAPEFLRERRWQQDCLENPWILGSDGAEHRVIPVPSGRRAYYITLAEAEVTKMMTNSYAALRVVFANHIHDLARAYGGDYVRIEKIYEDIQLRDQNYLQVTPELRGFGGKCLPKDLDFLIGSFARAGLPQTLFDSVRDDNARWPVTVRKN